MTSPYRKWASARRTPQRQPIMGEPMVQNNAGGFVYQVDRWTQLERFLILGSEGGTYYVTEQKLTVENAQNVLACIQEDGARVLRTIVAVSDAGRAPKNDPALFALAMCAGMGDEATRKGAFEVLPKVARIGTHLLHFASYMENFRGWGRSARNGVGEWFLQLPVEQLGYQFLKYAQRDGWSMRDLLRLAHPKTEDPSRNALFKYIVKGETDELLPAQIRAARHLDPLMALTPEGRSNAAALIVNHRLPREAVPTQLLNCIEVWEALLEHMPITAMIRNLGKMTEMGLIAPMSGSAKKVASVLGNSEALQKARIHPINVLAALLTYQRGAGFRGKLAWNPVPKVIDALDGAFYASFKFVEPTGKNILIGLDVSGSMAGASVNGMPFMTARDASAAMAMVTARTEENWHMLGFSHELIPLPISAKQRLDDVVRTVHNLRFGATDCALPMLYALANRIPVDAFVIYTDNETWYGDVHPVQALRMYREQMGIPAKLVTCALTATKFSIGQRTGKGYGRIFADDPPAIADPNDAGMLDVAGLDSAAPQVIADFIRG